ncbi:MAG TPA: DUF2752 domain-containing protein [Cellulomonas sp.]
MATVVEPARPAAVRGRGDGARRPLLVGASVAAATALVALRDPHVPWSYGICPLHAATGLWCPACGGLRATYDLAHLHLAAAWSENALWVVLAPLVVVGWLVWLVRRARGLPARPVPAWAGAVGLVVVVAFGVLRNLPAFAWLAP